MWRTLCSTLGVAALFYGIGTPWLDGYRPAAIDAALQAFHRQVNSAAQEGQRTLTSVNEARAGYLKAYMGRAEKQLRE